MCDIAYEKSWILDAKDMRLPVRALDDAHDIRIEEDLTRYLLESMCVLQVDWPKVVNPHRITHIVDLGPGGIAGFGYLAYRNIEGSGVPVICIGALASSSAHPHIGTKAELYKCYIDDIVTAPNWLAEFGPKLVRTVFDGQVHIDTHMHRVLGQPPVMVAGMTPTTANEAFVAAINSAGYHAEIAGGGMHTKKDMVRKLTALVEMIPPGQGITLNCIYVSQKQWSFQFPTLLRLRKEGIPIAGLCIGGGVPSFEAAMDIIKSLRSAGIYHMSFKPGNAASIRNVLRIAQANNGFSIILQWTGGRSGGHHSLEDFHQPLLETYSAIRAYNNVVLVVGSGFGDAKGTLPYITGEWSVKYGRTPMPVDGILLGSRVMVAKEAATSLKAKELIVSAPGMSDEQWSTTFNEEGSGVTAMVSEYGESNHALATRATMFINHLRSTVFSQPRNKQTMLLQERKQDIVARLNSDFFRPWFGKKRDGRVVDLDEMTYAEVIGRMVELMYVAHQKRWICESYFHCVLEFTNRIERRVQNQVLDIPISMLLYKVTPIDYATAIVGIYPIAETLVIASEDIQFLIEMWKRRGQKPFPFILVLDQDFSDLLLRDSIWQSEDLDSVVGHDPQRTSIQQGPVSARYSTVVDEPVKVILDGIYHAHIDALLERDYSSDKNLVPVVEYIGDDPPLLSLPEGVRVVDLADRRVFYLPDKSDQLPETSLWLEAVSGQKKSWLRALLTSQIAVQGSKYMPNVAQRVMRPRPNRVVTVYLHEGAPQSLEIATVDTDIPELRIIRGKSDEDILLTIYHPTTSSGIGTLDLKFIYLPRLEFVLDSEYRFQGSGLYSSVSTLGKCLAKQEDGTMLHIANIDFEWNSCAEDPVIEFLGRFRVESTTRLFKDGERLLELPPLSIDQPHIAVPDSNLEYANISGDINHIHVNPYIADVAGLPGTITHGMWTNAATRALVEIYAADSDQRRIRSFDVEFTGMVQPRDKLSVEIAHIGMDSGRMLISAKTTNFSGDVVLKCKAEVEQPKTAYVFTGQGSQTVGLGMDLYEQSNAARDVWDRAEMHMVRTYGISLLEVVRSNPSRMTIKFKSQMGFQVLDRYLDLKENALEQQIQMFLGLCHESESHEFYSPTGLLDSTAFTQPILAVFATAFVADMRSSGILQSTSIFAGHSLGEYAALASLGGGLLSVEDIMDVAFYRGLLMQSVVTRDESGFSEYGMVSVDPSRVETGFDEDKLRLVIDAICKDNADLLEIANHNVQDQQYVVSGTRFQLATMRMVLDTLASSPVSLAAEAIQQAVSRVLQSTEYATLSAIADRFDSKMLRGRATVPLDGIDVPFHSSKLLPCVAPLRRMLEKHIYPANVDVAALDGRYVPNLTGVPFVVSKEYFELVFELTQSPVLGLALEKWNNTLLTNPTDKQQAAHKLLIELLAYQVALPVQWIKTQQKLLFEEDVRRVIEIGAAPVLCGVARKIIDEQFNAFVDDVSILHIERDKDSIYYTHKSSTLSDSVGTPATHSSPADSADSSSESEKSSVAITLVASIEELPPATTTSYTGSEDAIIASAEFDDEPLTSLEVITAVIAQKFKMPYKDVKPDKSIKAMAAGNSTLQNEIVGDLHKEFSGQVPNKAEELSFQELSASIGSFNGELGKHTQTQLARLFRNKMPGGFSLASAREILQSTYSLGPHRQSGVLLHALANEPSSRLSNNDKAKEWLGDAAQQYAKSADISYSSARSGRAGAQQNALVYNSADVMELQKLQTQQQIEVLARYAGLDLREGARRAEDEQTKCVSLQSKLDKLRDELGDEFTEGVMPLFKAQMARNFDSSWNWVRQDAFEWIQQAITAVDVSEKVDPARIHRIENGADALLKSRLEGLVCTLQENKDGFNVDIALNLAQTLCKACTNALSKKPTYKEHSLPLQPTTRVLIDGQIEYKEKLRVGEATFANYVEHMRLAVQAKPTDVRSESPLPLLYLKTQSGSVDWRYDQPLSSTYHDGLKELCADGLSFAGKTALVTGCGRGSIGAEIVRGLLMGGAKVLATTSSYSRPSILFFEEMYQTYAARGAQLVVVPFNQGSAQDVKQLIDYAYDSSSGGGSNALGWDFDYIVPFAACSDNGTLATHIGPRSELAQRIMLINVIRLIGGIKTKKEKLGRVFNSSLVVLPLSPNHGTLGGDGLYGECKLGLETLLNRWKSEHWQDYISIVGTVIGWTRGTGLMSGNNILAQGVEELGVRTFSTREMAFNILGLMHSRMHKACIQKPVYADFAANLNEIKDLSMAVTQIQGKIRRQSDILVNVMSQLVRQNSVLFPNIALAQKCLPEMTPLAKHKIHIPTPKQHSELNHLHHLQDMVNLDKVVVIVGYGEVGPFGNADTRWEIEAFDDLTTEGCIELAWVMGLIKRFNGVLPSSGKAYIGWVDCKSGKPVKDVEVKPRYLDYILAHTGIRLMEPELMGGYDPHSKAAQREVQIEHDMQPFETGAEDAAAFKASNGDKVDVWPNASGTSWSVRLLKGALIRVPVAVDVDRLVAGLIPTGWSAERYGIPDYVVKQVDDTTLYMLVAVVEALLRAGITDPYELYRYFHVSEVGNSIGSGLGGGKALQDVFRKRNLEHDMQSDILQETFISTIQAWINMLLMSSAGPVKPVVGACATGLLSIDVAVETIQSGKAKVMLAGGVDDITEEPINEFASMGATSSSLKEIALGRTPKESSRPCTSTRGGFVEGHGAGAVVLMSASAAIKCGAPIYGIVAMSRMASDKQGSSVPAPGKGVLTVAQEINSHSGDCEPVPRSLDIGYRHRMIQMHLTTLDGWRQSEIEAVDESNKHKQHTLAHIERDYQRQKASIQDTWGNEFWKNNTYMSPVRGSLAVWGLSVDDIGVASFHGTSTAANDKNESSILNTQFRHLGRTSGHAVPVVCQKWLTGHSKGGAAMFMLNGVLQSLHTGIVPGNRNADNIDDEFKSNEYALYLSRTIQTAGIKAAMLTSFGFGQVGGEVLIVHPDHLFATLECKQLEEYRNKLSKRDLKANRYWQDTLVGNHPFVQVKRNPPFSQEQEEQVYLNPAARAQFKNITRDFAF
ncbi:fatty acid synthase alpha subunit Lsd1 [Coemansia sp. RSA 1646]|nr:fatty acid synthase alpha subunit Lsd1 [Coemansia sp. RSA 1646]